MIRKCGRQSKRIKWFPNEKHHEKYKSLNQCVVTLTVHSRYTNQFFLSACNTLAYIITQRSVASLAYSAIVYLLFFTSSLSLYLSPYMWMSPINLDANKMH